jgi:hypothetical protein
MRNTPERSNFWLTMALGLELAAAAAAGVGWLAYRQWGRPAVESLYEQRGISLLVVPDAVRSRATADDCYRWGGGFLGGAAIVMAGAAAATYGLSRDAAAGVRAAVPGQALAWGVPLATAAALFVAYQYACYEGEFYRIEDAMRLRVEPPFRHRVLFVGAAWGLKSLAPELSYRQAFLVTQAAAAVLAVWATQAWCRRVASLRACALAGPVAGMMLVPTFQYYTFYDFGIVFFYALGLLLLHDRRYLAFVLLGAVGTLNHELMLFLMLLSGLLVRAQGESWRFAIGLVAAQLALYAVVRGVLFWLMPVEIAWLPGKIWLNVERLVHLDYLRRTAALMCWFVLAIVVGARAAGAPLLCAIALLPLLWGMTLLVGQINEARQFVAFVPVATALLLVGYDRLGREAAADGDGRALGT